MDKEVQIMWFEKNTRNEKNITQTTKKKIGSDNQWNKHKQCCGQKIQRYLKKEYGYEV